MRVMYYLHVLTGLVSNLCGLQVILCCFLNLDLGNKVWEGVVIVIYKYRHSSHSKLLWILGYYFREPLIEDIFLVFWCQLLATLSSLDIFLCAFNTCLWMLQISTSFQGRSFQREAFSIGRRMYRVYISNILPNWLGKYSIFCLV